MTAVFALAYGSLGEGRSDSKNPNTGFGVDSLLGSNVEEASSIVCRD